MIGVEDFRSVIRGRMNNLGDNLLKNLVSDAFDNDLSKVYKELNEITCLSRDWKGLASHLILDVGTIHGLEKCKNPASELLRVWVEVVEDCGEEATYNALLKAMVDKRLYSAADELLTYLESLDECDFIPEDECGGNVDERQEIIERPATYNEAKTCKVEFERSKSVVERAISRVKKVFRRSKSCPEGIPTVPPQPKIKQDEIFIVSSVSDYQRDATKNIESFIRRLKPIRSQEWHLRTIHDTPDGMTTASWLETRVQRAKYVIICCSSIIKKVADYDTTDNVEALTQDELNLKFTLEFLIKGCLYRNACLNPGGKFLPVLLPGNSFSCVINPLANFKVFNWPDDRERIRCYILGKPERPVPKVGPRIPLVSCQLS